MGDSNINNLIERILAKIKLGNIIAAAIVCAMVIWVWATIVALNKNYELEKQVQLGRLENEVQEIENENLRLQQVYYRTDEFLELTAREKLNKALPGEHLVILPTTEKSKVVDTGVAAVATDDRSNFEKWIEFLLGSRTN
jgi:hypothetical protein